MAGFFQSLLPREIVPLLFVRMAEAGGIGSNIGQQSRKIDAASVVRLQDGYRHIVVFQADVTVHALHYLVIDVDNMIFAVQNIFYNTVVHFDLFQNIVRAVKLKKLRLRDFDSAVLVEAVVIVKPVWFYRAACAVGHHVKRILLHSEGAVRHLRKVLRIARYDRF